MPEYPKPPLPQWGPLSVGSALQRTWATLCRNLPAFLGLALLSVLPVAVLESLLPQILGLEILYLALDMILGLIIEAAVVYAAWQVLRGNRVSPERALAALAGHFRPLVHLAVVAGCGITLGLTLLIIPGLILSCLWAVAVPACMLEGLERLDGLKRSYALCKDHLPYLLLLFAAMLAISFLPAALAYYWPQLPDTPAGFAVQLGLLGLFRAYSSVLSTVLYFDLTAAAEGPARLARFFDKPGREP